MKIYCMSDIHGCLAEFEETLSLVLEHLREEDTIPLLLGDYVHGGPDNRGVPKRIMGLQAKYGPGTLRCISPTPMQRIHIPLSRGEASGAGILWGRRVPQRP